MNKKYLEAMELFQKMRYTPNRDFMVIVRYGKNVKIEYDDYSFESINGAKNVNHEDEFLDFSDKHFRNYTPTPVNTRSCTQINSDISKVLSKCGLRREEFINECRRFNYHLHDIFYGDLSRDYEVDRNAKPVGTIVSIEEGRICVLSHRYFANTIYSSTMNRDIANLVQRIKNFKMLCPYGTWSLPDITFLNDSLARTTERRTPLFEDISRNMRKLGVYDFSYREIAAINQKTIGYYDSYPLTGRWKFFFECFYPLFSGKVTVRVYPMLYLNTPWHYWK